MRGKGRTGRILTAILTAAVVVSSLPFGVYAADENAGNSVLTEEKDEKSIGEGRASEPGVEGVDAEQKPSVEGENEEQNPSGENGDTEQKPDGESEDAEQKPGTAGDSGIGDGENMEESGGTAGEDTLKEEEADQTEEKLVEVTAASLTTSADDIASGVVDESYGHIEWVIDKDGKLTVSGTGDFADPGGEANVDRAPWHNYIDYIKTAEVRATGMTCADFMFYNCWNLTSIDLSGFDTRVVKSMEQMFWACYNLTSIDLSSFDTGNVTNMRGMFYDCQGLTSIDLSSFDTSNVTDMKEMFYYCSHLPSINLSNFDTGNVTDMDSMFSDCKCLESLDLSSFNTSNVIYMRDMFERCDSLTSIDLSSFDTSNITNMVSMFSSCVSLTSIDLSSFDTSNVGDMRYMFNNCRSLTSIDLSSFDTSNLIDMRDMFHGCRDLTSIDLSNFDLGKAGSMGSMFADCGLTTIYTPYNVKAECGLPYDGTWYRDDGTIVTQLPQNLSYSVVLGKNYIPEKLPHDPEAPEKPVEFPTEMTVNGKGYAYANFILKNNAGEIKKNAKVTYSIDNTCYEASSDEEGRIALKSPLLENTGSEEEKRKIVVQDIILCYDSGETENLDYDITMDVTITPLSFTQKWELGLEGSLGLSISGGVGASAGVAEAEAGLAKAKIKGSSGGTLSVEHAFEEGNRKLTLQQEYEAKVAARASVGPAAKAGAVGKDVVEITPITAKEGVSSGATVGIGMEVDDYNPTDAGQLAQIGKFMVATQAQATGNMMLLKAVELAGIDFWNLEQYGAAVSVDAGVDAGSIKFGDTAEGTLASVKASQTLSYEVEKDKRDSSSEQEFTYEMGIDGSLDGVESDICHIKKDVFSGSVNQKLKISAGFDRERQIESFTIKKEEKSADSFICEFGTMEGASVTYDRSVMEQIKNDISLADGFISGDVQYILGDEQGKLFRQLDATQIKGSYAETTAEIESIDFDFPFKLELLVGAEASVGLEGSYSCAYETAGGIYESGRKTITNTNEIKADVKENAYSLNKIVTEPITKAADSLADFFSDVWDSAKNGIKKGLAEVKENISETAKWWQVHIVTLVGARSMRTEPFQSYEITAYSGEMLETAGNVDEEEYIAYTVGDPYTVYVTDETGAEVADYSESPLTLSLGYSDEMLSAAGLSADEAGRLSVYQYSEDILGYVCIGGTAEPETKTVSIQITKPGQYVLAFDDKAPVVRNIKVTPDSNKPLITVEFNETSGFKEFSMKLDGEEVIGVADWNSHYHNVSNSFTYQVDRELADGKHTVSVYAVDTAGNAMTAPYEMEFIIGDTSGGDKPGEDIPGGDKPGDNTPNGIWAEGIEDCAYTGNAVTQSFILYDGKKRLEEKTDYTFSYKNNKVAYTYLDKDYQTFEENLKKTGKCVKTGSFDPKKAPQLIISMKGNYGGKKTVYFKIEPLNISGEDFEADALSVTYMGKKQTPVPKLFWHGKALKYGTDFYVPEYDSAKNDKNAFRESKTYNLTLTGKKNFTGTRQITLTVSSSGNEIAMDKVAVKGIKSMAWTGNKIVQSDFSVTYKNRALSPKNGEYKVDWGKNTDVGTGTLILTGTGQDGDGDGISFIGTKKVSFKITGVPMSKVSVSGVERRYTYTGAEIRPTAKLYCQTDGSALTENIHYSVEYRKNADKGTATMIFTGLAGGGFTGTKKVTFQIVSGDVGDGLQVAFMDASRMKDGVYIAPYMKGGAKPEVAVTIGGRLLKEGKDYKISYVNNRKVATYSDAKAPAVVVTGRGNYKGKKSVVFSIVPKTLTNENGITIVAKDKVAGTKANSFKQSFKVYDADGKALGGGDYDTKSVLYTLVEPVAENAVEKVLDKTSVVPADSVVRITVKGKGIYAGGEASGTYRILKQNCDISGAVIQIAGQPYTGEQVEITRQDQFMDGKVYLKSGKTKKILILGEDIEVVPGSYVKNINKGTAKVTFRGIRDYGGTKTVSFKIGTRSVEEFWNGIFGKMKAFMF